MTVAEDNLKPGFHLPAHRHRSMAEIFYILDGEVAFTFEDQSATATPGTTVQRPGRGQRHRRGLPARRPAPDDLLAGAASSATWPSSRG